MRRQIADFQERIIDDLRKGWECFLLGNSDTMILGKKLAKSIENIEDLPNKEKIKVYYFIDMALSHHKAKKAFK